MPALDPQQDADASATATTSASRIGKAPAKAKWNFMVYMAANNSLSNAAIEDLAGIKKVGSTADVKVFVFLHHRGAPARHIEILEAGQATETSLSDVDSGDPQTVLDFFEWAVGRAPADRHALVLWNHGGGWQPEDLDQLYKPVSRISPPPPANASIAPISRILFQPARVKAPLEARDIFTHDAGMGEHSGELAPGGVVSIGDDETTGHSLDAIEVDNVLSRTAEIVGPLDLFGMDACDMATLEVAYQVAPHVQNIVGSEAAEPNAGWCYPVILRALAGAPDWDGSELAIQIVGSYRDFYTARRGQWQNVSQCAVSSVSLPDFSKAFDSFVMHLSAGLADPQTMGAIKQAQVDATLFDLDQRDLRTFCKSMVRNLPPTDLRKAAAAVIEALRKCMLDEWHSGNYVEARGGIGGLSIYFPMPGRAASKFYRHLTFAQKHPWEKFLGEYLARK